MADPDRRGGSSPTGVLEEELSRFAEKEDKFGPRGLILFRDFYFKK